MAMTHPVRKCVTGLMAGASGGLDLDQDFAIFHFDGIDRDFGSGIVDGLASLGIPLPAMPWTNEFAPFDDSLPQRSTTMQADVVHCGDSAVNVGDADDLVPTGEFASFAFGRKFRLRGEFGEGGHGVLGARSR